MNEANEPRKQPVVIRFYQQILWITVGLAIVIVGVWLLAPADYSVLGIELNAKTVIAALMAASAIITGVTGEKDRHKEKTTQGKMQTIEDRLNENEKTLMVFSNELDGWNEKKVYYNNTIKGLIGDNAELKQKVERLSLALAKAARGEKEPLGVETNKRE